LDGRSHTRLGRVTQKMICQFLRVWMMIYPMAAKQQNRIEP
jgi:hypothetical protein